MRKLLASLLVLAASGCPSVTVDEEEGADRAEIEFNPAGKIIPFPNNLLLDPATGKVALPQQCNESPTSAATRASINKLDGFGTYEPTLNVTFTEPVDLTSLANRVLLYQRVRAGTAQDPASAVPIPVIAIPGKAIRYGNQADLAACTDPAMIEQVTFVPTRALDQKSTYTVVLLDGIKTAAGPDFNASFTWTLIREPEPVVVIDDDGNVTTNRTPLDPFSTAGRASLAGIDLLWKAHATGLAFLAGAGHSSDQILLAWEFNTQTITDPFDATVAGSPASAPTLLPLLGNQSLAALATARTGVFAQCPNNITDTQCLLRILLGAGNYTVGTATCAAAGCAAISDVLGSLLLSKQYQADVPNTLYTGTGTTAIPGAWSDPLKPTVVHDTNNANPLANDAQAKISAIVLIPQGTAPTAGWPTVIFQHGITRSRGDVLAVAGNLASQGFAVVAIDAVNHGSRAVRISNAASADPDVNCVDVTVGIPSARPDLGPDPTAKSGCYAPVLSPDLAATRDSFRQTVLDIQQLVTSLKACGTTACGSLKVDPTKIMYLGHSLVGGNFGAIVMPFADIKAGVLNAAGAGWLDIIENTEATEQFQCPLVDALIAAGFLTGAPYDKVAMTGLCTTDAWKTMPGYRQFAAIGRWLLDSADPANFAGRLGAEKFLLQEIENDEVVPNIATDNLGALAGQPRADASCGIPFGGPSIPPSTAILAAPMQSHFLQYRQYAPGNAECLVGNTYSHGSLLKPEPSVLGGTCNPSTGANCDGTFATVRLQTDAVFYLLSNK